MNRRRVLGCLFFHVENFVALLCMNQSRRNASGETLVQRERDKLGKLSNVV